MVRSGLEIAPCSPGWDGLAGGDQPQSDPSGNCRKLGRSTLGSTFQL